MSSHGGAGDDGADEHFSNWDEEGEGGGEGSGGDGSYDDEGEDFDPSEGVYTESGAYADDGSGDSLYDGDEGAETGAGEGDEGIHTVDEEQPGRSDEGEGDEGGVDPAEEAKLAALDAARQKALSKLRPGMSFAAAAGAVPAQAKPSFTSRAAAAAAAASPPPPAATAPAAAAPAAKGKSMRDRRKEAKEAKQAAQRAPITAGASAPAAAAGASGAGALSAKEQAKLDRAARFAPTNASAAASALAPPSHSSFSASRSPSHSPSPSPDFGAPPAFIGGRGPPRSTASLMAMAMGGADDSGGLGGVGDEEGYSAESYAPIVGQCMLMCPLEEQQARQESRDLSYFEVVPGTGSKEHGDVPLVDPAKAVKKYKRAAAAQTLHPKDVRPPRVLRQTMDYLVREIMDRRDSPDPAPLPSFLVIYRFVSDRMRALRQDFACQGRRDALAIDCYETMVRFHVLTMFELGDVANLEKFDPTPNMEKLSQTLTSLRHMFYDNYTTSTGAPFPTPNEAEMHSYRLLIDLDRRFATLYEELDKFDPRVKNSPIVQLCVQVYNAFRENNYARFFELARAAPYCHAVLLGLHFNKVRARALEVMSHAYRFFPFGEFVEALAFESNQHAMDFLAFHGIDTDDIAHTQVIAFKTRGVGSFQHPERGATPFPQRNSWKIVGAKRPVLVSQAALQGIGRGEGLGLERFLPGTALASASAAAASSSSSSSLVRSRAMVLPRAQPLPAPSAVTLPSFGNMGSAASSGFAPVFGQQQPASSASAFGLPTPQPMPSSAFGGGASGRPAFGSGAGTGPSSAGSAFGAGASLSASAFEMPPPGSLDGVVSKPTKFNRGAVSSVGATAATTTQAAPAATTSLNPKAAPFMPAAGTSAAAAPASTTSAFGGGGAFGSGSSLSASSSGFGGGGAFGASSTVGFGGFSAAFGNGQSAVPATTTAGAAATGSAFGASPVGSVFGSGASPAPTTAVSAFGRDAAAPAAAAAAAPSLPSGFAPTKPSAAPVAAAPAFPASFAATVAASASRQAAAPAAAPAPPSSSTSAIVPGQTAHISGFQLPVATPRPAAAAPSSTSTAAPVAAASAVPPPHPRPPMSVQRATAAATAAAAAAAAPVPMAVAAPSKPIKPVLTPAQTQEMFLASLRCYRRSLLRRGLRSWHEQSAERTRVRGEAAAAQAVLERRADTFAATKWFLRWHAGMVQHQRAQQRFMQAQAALHAPLSVHLAAKLPFKTRGGASAQRLLSAPTSHSGGGGALVPSPGASHRGGLLAGANGVTSGLASPLAKLQRMGIARGEMLLSGEEPFEDEHEYAQEGEEQYEEEPSYGQLNFDEGVEEEGDEWQYANGDASADGELAEGDESYADENEGGAGDYEADHQAEYNGEGDEVAEEGDYDEQEAEEDDGGVAPMDQGEDDQPFAPTASASRSSAPAPAASRASRGPLSPAVRSPSTKAAPRVSLHFTSPLTPLRNGGMGVGGVGGSSIGSHKRSRQSIEVDRFLAQFVSPSRRRVASIPAAPAPTPAHPQAQSHSHALPMQQPAAVFDSEANHASLYDDSEGEEEHAGAGRSGRRSTARLKLFHTPSHATPRAVFTSPAAATSSSAYVRSALDVSAALAAASADSPSTYLKARPSYAAYATGSSSATAAPGAARPRDLVQQVQSELRQSSKLDELMQQLEFRYGAQI